MSKDLDHDKWLKQYRYKLIAAWKAGFDDKGTAEKLEIPFEEYERHLAVDEHLRQLRDKHVDELRRIARDSIAEKIRAGDRQTCEWYLEKTDPKFGAKSLYEEVEADDSLSSRRADIKAKLDGFISGHKFNGNK